MQKPSPIARALQRTAHGRTHISTAAAEFAAYLNDNEALGLDLIQTPAGHGTRAVLTIHKSLPTSVTLAVADALQSLRIALDSLWTGLSAPTSDDSSTFSFPWLLDPVEAATVLNVAPAVRRIPILKEFIINRVRPWPQGNPVISGLFQITERDRHGLLDLAFSTARIISGKAAGEINKDIDLAGLALSGAERPSIAWPDKVTLNGRATVAVDLVFGPREIHAGNNVFEGLKVTHNQVAQIIHEVGHLCSEHAGKSALQKGNGIEDVIA